MNPEVCCTKEYREGASLWDDKEIMSKADKFRPVSQRQQPTAPTGGAFMPRAAAAASTAAPRLELRQAAENPALAFLPAAVPLRPPRPGKGGRPQSARACMAVQSRGQAGQVAVLVPDACAHRRAARAPPCQVGATSAALTLPHALLLQLGKASTASGNF